VEEKKKLQESKGTRRKKRMVEISYKTEEYKNQEKRGVMGV
jgi:hypothetical protein